jgi:hypothetical protein
MPLAGQTVKALDFAGYASTTNATDETAFTSTSYTLGVSTCGVSFIAPTSGAVKITWGARFALGTDTNLTLVSAEVRTGSTVGSGTVVDAASDNSALEHGQASTDRLQASRHRAVTGLTAGSTYNVSLWHKTTSGDNSTIYQRDVMVEPIFD